MSEDYFQTDQFTAVVSPLTGNTVYRNDSDLQYLLPPTFEIYKARVVCARVITGWTLEEYWVRLIGTQYETVCLVLAKAKTKSKFISAFNGVLNTINSSKPADQPILIKTGLRRRVLELTSALWEEGQLASPLKQPMIGKTNAAFDSLKLSPRMAWIASVSEACNASAEHSKRAAAFRVWKLAMTAAGVKEIGDITPDCTRRDSIDNYRGAGIHAIRPLIAVQKVVYGSKMKLTEHDWGWGRGRPKSREDYSAAVEKDPSLGEWRDLLMEWMAEHATTHGGHKQDVALTFLNYLLSHDAVTRSSIEFVSRSYQHPVRYEQWIHQQSYMEATVAKYIGSIGNFFDWLVDVKLALEDDFGRPVRNPALYNPITRIRAKPRAAQTAREALPIRYLRELIHIISANDFEWAKGISEDHIKLYNHKSRAWERIWSPVRTYLLLIKLYLPLRTYQVAMLDSGEADSMIYDAGSWVPNAGPLAPKRGQVSKGFLREFKDAGTSTSFTGFYVNTNKTADRFKDVDDKGYQIPWQHNEVIDLVSRLCDWQKTYNPITCPTRWEDLTNPTFRRGYTDAQLRARGEACFLFRDPVRARKEQPIYTGRVQSFWWKVLDELERRVAARGEKLPNGEPIRFIEKRTPDGAPLVPVFDLHSLRVSILTALAVEGGVPLSILSKCVAGHASVLMTLYYLKPGPAYVSQQMAEAQAKMLEQEQDNYLRFLQNSDLNNAQSLVAFNDQAALSAASSVSPASWVIGDLGICPVGASKCHIGGPKVSGDNTRNEYLPTPGGARNCVRCRFFMTGPAFLGGLVASFNSIGLQVTEASDQLHKMQADISGIEDGLFGEGVVDPGAYRKVDVMYSRRETAMNNLDELANNWHATFIFIERAKALLGNTSDTKNDVRLLTSGGISDVATVLGSATKFDVYNNICQHATIYPAATVPIATLRRGRLLDAMLARNQRFPVFAELTDEQALSVGNELVNLLYTRLGHNETSNIIEGRRLLHATGMDVELDALLKNDQLSPIRIQPNDSPPRLAATSPSHSFGVTQ